MCATSDSACNSKLSKVEKNTSTIHGLWPSLVSGARIPECNSGATIQIKPDQLSNYGILQQLWPSLSSNTEVSFWTHEYNKHGYCYVVKNGKSAYSYYFETVVQVFNNNGYKYAFQKAFPGQTGEKTYNHVDLFNKLAGALGHRNFKMLCRKLDGQQRITELYISIGLDFKPIPAKMSSSCPTKSPIVVKFK